MLVLASPGPSGGMDDNPYIRLLYAAVADNGGQEAVQVKDFDRAALLTRPDVVHVHWPYHLVRWTRLPVAVVDIVKLIGLLAIARRRGAALVWTAHDLEPHEVLRPRLWAFYFWVFCHQVDLLVLLSASSRDQLVAKYPALAGKPVRIIPHGHYQGEYAAPPPAADARADLGLADRPTVLAFGQIRPYKRSVELARAFQGRQAAERESPQLVIAGEAKDGAIRKDLSALTTDDVRTFLDLVPHEQVPAFFGACDVAVLPYSTGSALNSGVALLALSMGKPVVMVDTPVGRELQQLVGEEWLTLTSDSMGEILGAALDRAQRHPPAALDLSGLAWPQLGALTISAYKDAIAARKR
jgi:beta-1,4-mannosyltransferase